MWHKIVFTWGAPTYIYIDIGQGKHFPVREATVTLVSTLHCHPTLFMDWGRDYCRVGILGTGYLLKKILFFFRPKANSWFMHLHTSNARNFNLILSDPVTSAFCRCRIVTDFLRFVPRYHIKNEFNPNIVTMFYS